MKKEVLRVSGMDCPSCAKDIEKTVAKLNGVEKAEVNFIAEKLTVTYDDSQLPREKIEENLKKIGHPVVK
ncbi:heavy-metal-associated domain-containing protein [Chryseomicrobium aureum]|jgi:copper chaperone CopZ|uniref:heavy-metal-associated domain-containing protein n=1 Tax=Bacillales TaxID=1385 RepID=UPI0004951D36|nr:MULTISPECIES: cation transporter [Bacillales]KAA0954740.1 hypothetical protein FQ085_17850 [Planococcus sp. ANT_H30]MCM3034130.1 cation transporter [Niallia sp. MER 6]PKH10667.1 hypothetical protein CXF70_08630 [Planomicrobium sp. MB-3u-38]QJS06197.1 hypothetical protein [Planococcus sp. (in: firmicutes)]QJS06505.1 heavy-metal-associated domain-containing protein [Planococcus sp. (in: firmicutes)]